MKTISTRKLFLLFTVSALALSTVLTEETSASLQSTDDLKHLIEAEVERSVQEHLTQSINSQKLPDGKAPGNTLIFGFLKPFVDRLKGKAKEIKENGIVDSVIGAAKDQWENLPAEKRAEFQDDINKYIDWLKTKWTNAVQLDAFNHLVVRMDLENNMIVLESEQKGEDGEPIFTIQVDEQGQIMDPIAKVIFADTTEEVKENETPEVVVEGESAETSDKVEHKPEMIPIDATNNTPKSEETAPIITDDTKQIETEPVFVDKKDETAATPKLTEEEEFEMQREVAFKVVFFFVAFIIFCFALLYVYHRIQQQALPSSQQKQNFFDFLAGEIDDQEIGQIPNAGRYFR